MSTSSQRTEVRIRHVTKKGIKHTQSLSTNYGHKPEDILLGAVYELGILLAEEGKGEEAKQRLDLALKIHETHNSRTKTGTKS